MTIAHIDSFNRHGGDFWNERGAYKTLHQINPARLQLIERHVNLRHSRVLDVGCGGGILSEALAARGAIVKGVDLSPTVLTAAREHLALSGLAVDYELCSTAELVARGEQFDQVCCLEMLEHVQDPAAIVADLARLVKKGGHVFLSTVNRTAAAALGAIVIGEYLTKLIPRGTHDYHYFLRPDELVAMVERAGLRPVQLQGLDYNPISGRAHLSRNLAINYFLVAKHDR